MKPKTTAEQGDVDLDAIQTGGTQSPLGGITVCINFQFCYIIFTFKVSKEENQLLEHP